MKRKQVPWWLYVFLLVPVLSFVFFFVGAIVRYAVGLPLTNDTRSGFEFLTWILYTLAWMVFAIRIHRDEQGFNTYLPWSVLALGVATVGTFLVP